MEADFDVLKNAVVNAGFSVASFKILVIFLSKQLKMMHIFCSIIKRFIF
jgi:hypothetical protein